MGTDAGTTTGRTGIEQVLALAAIDPGFAAALRHDRAGAVADLGLPLSASEQALLAIMPQDQIDHHVAGVRRAAAREPIDDVGRRAFLGGATATLLGALAASACDGGRPRQVVESYRREVAAGGGGVTGIRPGKGGYGIIGRPRRPYLVLRQKSISVEGKQDLAVIRRVFRRQFLALKHCFTREVGLERKGAVSVDVSFTIAGTGRVAAAAVTRCAIDNEAFTKGVVKIVRRTRFPRSKKGAPARVEVGLEFEVMHPKKPKKKG